MADYDFYKSKYLGGSIPEADFHRLSKRAGEELARYKRIYTVTTPKDTPDAEDMAICAMAEALYGIELIANGEGGAVQSASIGSVSISYGGYGSAGGNQAVDVTPAGQTRELFRAACLYLDIYRGVG